jgi:hypothetical protein
VKQRGQLHRFGDQIHLTSLDLGEIEQVVDQAKQVLAIVEDPALKQALLVGDRAVLGITQGVREVDDRVERRAQLVAHVGQETRFVEICFFRSCASALSHRVGHH